MCAGFEQYLPEARRLAARSRKLIIEYETSLDTAHWLDPGKRKRQQGCQI